MICSNCNAQSPENSLFCGRCGSRLAVNTPRLCSQCNSVIPDGMYFCSKCGTKAGVGAAPQPQTYNPPPPQQQAYNPPPPQTSGNYSLTVTRESAFAGAMTGVSVVVNGIGHGSLSSGETKNISLSSPDVVIELKARGVKCARARQRIGNNAHVSFKQQASLGWNKIVFNNITGAEILEKQP